MVEILLI